MTNLKQKFKKMKNFKNTLLFLLTFTFIVSCDEGIDSITNVPQGADETAPVVTISSPTDGGLIQTEDEISSLPITFNVTDDIEVVSIVVDIDGTVLANLSGFLDYRIVNDEVIYDQLTHGEHTVTITATDIDGKVTVQTSNFEKIFPLTYTPIYGETFYMPFNGAYTELVTAQEPTVVGTPSFDSGISGQAYKGTPDSYLTFPSTGLLDGDGFSASFWYNLNSSPDRSGIITMSAPSDSNHDLNFGLRFFREGSADSQVFKLNIGNGAGDEWYQDDGLSWNPANVEWIHIAISVSADTIALYINGQVIAENSNFGGIDWTGCDEIVIGSGAPNFIGWSHFSDCSPLDELRFFDRAITQTEVLTIMDAPIPTFRMTFEGDSFTDVISGTNATVVGVPSASAEGYNSSNAYQGTEDSYLTFPSAGLLGGDFSTSFWYNLNSDPDRSGILTISAPGNHNLDFGLRFFREGSSDSQVFKLNIGNGSGNEWHQDDGLSWNPVDVEWINVAITVSSSTITLYINGEVVTQNSFGGIDWTGCDEIVIGSGAPRFIDWSHFSDNSLVDDIKFYNVELSQEEVQDIMNN